MGQRRQLIRLGALLVAAALGGCSSGGQLVPEVVLEVPASLAAATAVASEGGRDLWVLGHDARGAGLRLVRLDLSGRSLSDVPLIFERAPLDPWGLVVGRGGAWVSAGGMVARIDVSRGIIEEPIAVAGPSLGDLVSLGWVGGRLVAVEVNPTGHRATARSALYELDVKRWQAIERWRAPLGLDGLVPLAGGRFLGHEPGWVLCLGAAEGELVVEWPLAPEHEVTGQLAMAGGRLWGVALGGRRLFGFGLPEGAC